MSMMMRKIGRKMMSKSFSELYEAQKVNQQKMLNKGMYDVKLVSELPIDNVQLASYHVLQLMSEVGEVLDADKRWKNFRNEKYDKAGKAEEIADCFIVLMNIAMFSGISSEELVETISNKIEVVKERIESKR